MYPLTGKVYTFSNEEDDDPIYEELSELEEEDLLSYPKQPISSPEENHLSDTLESEPCAVASGSHGCAIADDSEAASIGAMDDDCDPSDSLLMLAPLCVPNLEDQCESLQEQEQPVPVVAAEEEVLEQGCTLSTWHQKLVNMFAGRKKVPGPQANKKRNSSTASPKPSRAEPVSPAVDSNEQHNPEETLPPATPPQPPRLTLRQVLPSDAAISAKHESVRPGYRQIRPAPMNAYTGYAVVTPDTFEPEIVQKGFAACQKSPEPANNPLAWRRNNSASSLLDRDGNPWAVWNERNPEPNKMPFARSLSDSEVRLHPRSAATRKPKGSPNAPGRLRAGSGFLASTGDQYPFAHGMCW
ncbi:hypothetical protein BDW02DRAFT_573437 [Decorospora gaudefroyi]|uniref:Uncharacterized protein n=1 Tax=Decorospora gaudefroyi TaxID=184978 RepID=A0A6A5K9E1_9PLEO|nr:hypothetical protein BDW02DRAFT_573437 [Decorospora gaudefroyi]